MGQRKYPPLTPAEVESILRALKFEYKRQEGSHRHYERQKDDTHPRSIVTVDMTVKEFDDFLIKSMVRQSNFTREQFYGATKRTAKRASVKQFVLNVTTELD